MASSSSSKDKHNFQCVAEASLELIKLPLKDILRSQIKPEDLFLKIKSSLLLSGRNELHPEQLKLCYLPPPLLPDYSKFDVTLLYTLIRNLCSGLKPTRGWGNDPDPKDTNIGDDVERLRLFRNKNFAHLNSATIPDDTFDDLWRTLEAVLSRLKCHSGCSVDYEQELIEIKRSKFRNEIWEDYRNLCKLYLELEKEVNERAEPSICIKGEEQIICGDTAEFKAEVKRAGKISFPIKWQRRRGQFVEILDTTLEKYSGSTDTRLIIPSVCKKDALVYQASLSDGNNHTLYSNAINLHVLGEKPMLNDLEVTTEDKGIIIHYSFEVSKNSPPVRDITWSKNAHPMYIKDDKFSGGSLHDIRLVIKSPSEDDKGNYSCTVTNDVGSVTKHIELDVPCVEISIEPTVHFASDTTVTSIVTSIPPPEKAQWQKSIQRIGFSEVDVTKSKYFGSNASPQCPCLVIPKTTFDDIGYYRLQISNKLGVNVSNSVYLNVTGSLPNITVSHGTDFMNRSIKLNGAVFVSDDSPDIQEVFWSKNGEKIDIQGSGGRLSGVTNDDPSLTIRNVSQEDAGIYRLTAINAIGQNNSVVISIDVPYLYIRSEKNLTGGIECLCFTVEITSDPGPCHAQWNFKSKGEETFTPLDVNAEKYQGSTNSLPHPKLVIKEKDQLKKNTYQIKVTNFVGSTVEEISDDENRPLQKQEDAVNGGPDRFYEHPLPSSQEISSNNEDIYRGEKIHFINFCDDLANQFPHEKIPRLKLYLNASGKLEKNSSLKAAHSVLEVFNVLLEENVFSRNDVLFLQIMLKRINCDDLYEKCIHYASTKRACFFESDSDDGNLKVHVKDDLNDDTEGKIKTIIKEISLILKHNKNNIRVIRLVPSTSFFLVLSIAEADTRKLLCLNEENQLKLRRLNIDYLIVDKEIITLERSKGIMNDENENKRDAGTVFADFCDDLAMNFPLIKLQELKICLKASSLIDLSSLEAADSPFECLALLLESQFFNMLDVVFLQFLFKTLHCEELYSKCLEFASRQHSHYFHESQSDRGFLSVQFNIGGSLEELPACRLQEIRETVATILNCSLEEIQIVHSSVKEKQECVADKSSAMSSGFEPSDEKCCFISIAKPSYLKEMKDPENIRARVLTVDSSSMYASGSEPSEEKYSTVSKAKPSDLKEMKDSGSTE